MTLFSFGQLWATEYNELYSCDFTTVATHSYTLNKTFTLGTKDWKSSVSQVNGGVFYLGCNSTNASKGILNDNSDFSDIVTALALEDAIYNSNKTTAHAYAMLFDNDYSDVTKISFAWDGGNNAFQVYLFGYTNSTWTLLESTNYATSGAAVAGEVEWTGSATDFDKFAIVARPGTTSSTATSKTLRARTFAIYETEDTGGTPTCATPTFSVAAGAVVSGTTVELSTTTEGATIHYTTNGVDPTTSDATYSTPIEITSETTIKAIAVKAGNNNSTVATAAYTVLTPQTISAIIPTETTEGAEFLLNDVTVTYANGNNVYVKDATGYIMVYSAIAGAENGKVLQGLQGKAKLYNGLPEVSTVTKAPTVTDGSAVAPEALTAYPIAADLNKYVTMEDVTFASAVSFTSGSVTNANGTFDGATLVFRNNFKLNVSLTAGTPYRVVGIVQKYNDNFQIYPISFEEIVSASQVATPTFSPAAGTYTEVQSVTLSCETSDASIYYTTNGDVPTSASTPYTSAISVGETMTIKAIAVKGGMDDSNVASATYTINLPLPSHDFQYTHNFTTGAGFEFPDGWSSSYAEHEIAFTNDKVVFESANQPSSTSAITDRPVTKNQAISLVLTNVAKVITAVRFDYAQWGTKAQTLTMKYSTDGGANYSDFSPVVSSSDFALQVLSLPENVNAIQVTGSNASNQVGLTSISFDLGDKAVVHGSITYVENGANEDIPDVADAISLPDPLPAVTKSNHKFGGWFTDSEFNTPAVAGAALTGDVTLYAKWTEIPVWATVYSSNVAMVHTGSGVDNGTITIGTDEPYLLVKAGASSNTGTIEVTIPAQTHTLHFHAFAWGGKTAKIQIAGVDNPSVTEFDLAGESGASGSGNDFTLAGDPIDQYFSVTFDAVATETIITFSKATGSADNRFFLYGVNQEGGVLPVLESIEISGDLTNKTGYKAGDALDLDGLTVEATYSLGGVNQTPVDITNDPDLALTYDPLAENQTEVTITASYKGQTDDITITGLDPVASADPLIYVSKLNVNFASVEVGDAVPAAQTITVTLTNVASVTATLGGTNADAFSISPTSLTASGDITISILANTDVAASYSATLTISDGEGGADDKTVNLSFAVTEPVAEDDVAGTWTLVTDAATLAAGKKVIVAQYVDADGAINTMAAQKSNNRGVVESAVAGTTLTPATGTKVMTLVDAGTGKFYLQTSDGKYLYNASTSGNSYLRTKDEETDASWTISVTAAGVATITSVENTNRTIMRYNENGTNPALFNCYASGQNDIALYMLEETTPPAKDVIRDGLSDGKWGTICPKQTVENVEGAVFYQITYLEEKDGMPYNIVLDEIGTTTLTAGKPYVFIASGTQILGNKTGDAVTAGQDHNGLYGYISATDESMALSYSTDFNASGDNTYVVYENSFYRINGATNLKSERCYININSTEPSRSYVAPNPVRRRITVNVSETNATTGFGEINSSDVPVKMIIDGKMYILRGEKLFDATGRLVK